MQIALSSRRRKFDKIFAVIFYARQPVEADRIPSTVRNSIFHPAFPHAACHAQKERGRKKMLKANEKGTSDWSTPKGCLENQLFIPVNSKQAAEADNDLPKELPREAHRMPLSGLDVYIFGLGTFRIFTFSIPALKKRIFEGKRRRRRQGSEFSSLLMSSFLTFQENESKERERKWENL